MKCEVRDYRRICKCGCGAEVRADVRGRPRQFISGHQNRGKNHPQFGKRKGTRYVATQGYAYIYLPDHHRADIRGYVKEHIIVMERLLNRNITVLEAVHHIDGNKSNNEPGNLFLFAIRAMHDAYHNRLRAFENCGHYEWRQCGRCHKWDDPRNMYIRKSNAKHRACHTEYEKKRRANNV